MTSEADIIEQYFFTTEAAFAGPYLFGPGFVGWVECKVGKKYLVHTCKEKSRQHVLGSNFFMVAQAQFFLEFEDMKEQRKRFLQRPN
jgi:hypothetical protein